MFFCVIGWCRFILCLLFHTLDVRLSSVSHWSVFHFRMITWVNINGFSPNLVCALILWRSGLGLLMGKFHQFLTELSAQDIFSFPDDNLSKCQGILTKLGTHIDIKKIWFGINCKWTNFVNFWQLSARGTIMAGYHHFTFLLCAETFSMLVLL